MGADTLSDPEDRRLSDNVQKVIDRTTDLERVIAQLEARADTGEREIDLLRTKQAEDMKQAADAAKTDWRVIIAGVAVGVSLLTLVYKAGYDADQSLLVEVSEAKAAAASAGRKAAPIAEALDKTKDRFIEQIEELQQRIPSESEWQTAMVKQRRIKEEQIGLLQRVKGNEGRIDRALLLVTKNEQSVENQILAIEDNMRQDDARMDRISSKVSSMASAVSGAIAEVEAQGRGLTATINQAVAGLRQNIAILWPHAMPNGSEMPPNNYFPDNIPASAIVEIGNVNGD